MEYLRKAAEKGHKKAQRDYGIGLILGEGEVKKDIKNGWRWIEKAAKQGEATAMFYLGEEYYNNYYDTAVPQDTVQGFAWLKRAADSNCLDAQLLIGDIYLSRADTTNTIKYYTMASEFPQRFPAYVSKSLDDMKQEITRVIFNLGSLHYSRKDAGTALEYWQKAAVLGHGEAAAGAGFLLLNGTEVKQDIPEGIWYTQEAMNLGCTNEALPSMQHDVGCYYWRGEGVKQDTLQAVRWWTKAAEAGNSDAQQNLAYYYSMEAYDNDSIIYWGEKPECRDSVSALFYVGCAYYERKEYEKAEAKLKKAAEQDLPEACFALAVLLYKEEEFKDSLAAFEYTKKAADLGSTWAFNDMGTYYLNGEFVEQNTDKAIELFTQAAEAGVVTAYYNLGVVYYNKVYRRKDRAMAAAMWKKGAEIVPEQDDTAYCQYGYGVVLLKGHGVKKDKEAAIHWLKLAARNGCTEAQEYLTKKHINFGQEEKSEPEKAVIGTAEPVMKQYRVTGVDGIGITFQEE